MTAIERFIPAFDDHHVFPHMGMGFRNRNMFPNVPEKQNEKLNYLLYDLFFLVLLSNLFPPPPLVVEYVPTIANKCTLTVKPRHTSRGGEKML